jgi:hypothetical protein
VSLPPRGGPPRRERVVLARRRGARVVRASFLRARVDVQEQTQVGEVLVAGLMRAQLGAALRLAGFLVGVVAVLPLLATLAPDALQGTVFGVRWYWVALGFLGFPALFGLGWVGARQAERIEQEFLDMVDE